MNVEPVVLRRMLTIAYESGWVEGGGQDDPEFDGSPSAWATLRREADQYAQLRVSKLRERTVADGFGSVWEKCDRLDCALQVVRPGKVQCECDR